MDIDELFSTDARLTFLVGSGVSLDYPSCQPTGYEFTHALVRHFLPPVARNRMARYLEPNPSKNFLRFEQLLEILQSWDPEFAVLNGYAECSEPNANHLVLAEFIRNGHSTFTTNFDSLIEHALAQSLSDETSIEPVIFESDWDRPVDDNRFRVFKLHGSLVDFRDGSDSRQSLQATIAQISVNKQNPFGLESWKRRCWQRHLEQSDLVVVGYSGLDDFDVLPTLRSIASERQVIWVHHDSTIAPQEANPEAVWQFNGKRPRDTTDQVLSYLAEASRDPARVLKLAVDTSSFLRELCHHFFGVSVPPGSGRCGSQQSIHRDWPVLNDAQKSFLAGEIASNFDPEVSAGLFSTTIELAAAIKDPWMTGRAQNYLGRQFEALFFEDTTDGPSEERQRCWDRAMDAYAAAQDTFEALDSPDARRELSSIKNNIGQLNSYRDGLAGVRKALPFYREALGISESLDHPEGMAVCYNNLAAAHYRLGDPKEAAELGVHACEMDRRIGDLGHLGVHLGNLGVYRLADGDDSCLDSLRDALAIGVELGSLMLQANTLHSLGQYWETKKAYETAIEFYEKSIAVAEGAKLATITGSSRESHKRVTDKMNGVTRLGLRCSCSHELNFKAEEIDLLVNNAVPMLMQCSQCDQPVLIVRVGDKLATYKVTNVEDGGKVETENLPITTCDVPDV